MSWLCKIFGHAYREYSRYGTYPYKRICGRCCKEQAFTGEWVDKTWKEIVLEDINEKLKNFKSNASLIKHEIENRFGGRVCSDGYGDMYVVGAVATEEDYYYIGIDAKSNVRYWSCVGGIEIVDNEEINKEFISLIEENYMSLKNKVENSIEYGDHVLFTELKFKNDRKTNI